MALVVALAQATHIFRIPQLFTSHAFQTYFSPPIRPGNADDNGRLKKTWTTQLLPKAIEDLYLMKSHSFRRSIR
jgi:hypothetical protein